MEKINVGMVWNENTSSYLFDIVVNIVNMNDICYRIDRYIGSVEYDDGTYLEIYCSTKDGLIGYWLSENDI